MPTSRRASRVVEEVAVALAGLLAGAGGVDGVADAREGRGDRIEAEKRGLEGGGDGGEVGHDGLRWFGLVMTRS